MFPVQDSSMTSNQPDDQRELAKAIVEEQERRKKAEQGQRTKQGCAGCAIVVVLVVVIAGIAGLCSLVSGDPTDACESDPQSVECAEVIQTQWEEDCFDSWDGNHRNFEVLVKEQLLAPASYEHHNTYFSTGDFPRTLRMEFSSQNVFGAMLRNTAHGTSDRSCDVEFLYIE